MNPAPELRLGPAAMRRIWILVVAGALVHVLAAVAVWLLLRKSGGLLPNSDEAFIISKADVIVRGWLEGRMVQWRDITYSETNPGFYYLVALVRHFLTEELLALRLMNAGLGLAALSAWYAILRVGGETRAAAAAFLLAAVWIPSPVLWCSLIIKEAMMYALLGLHVLAVARLLRGPGCSWADAALYVLSIVLLSCFRNYIAMIALALSATVLWYSRGARHGVVVPLAAFAAAVLLNPYALTLFAYKATGGWVSLHVVDWLLGHSELLVMGPPGTATGAWTVESISEGTSTGAAAIAAGTPVWMKAWLFVSYPLPWQATTLLQRVASPEAVLILLAMPLVAAGIALKLRQRDPLALYVLALMAALAVVYVTYVGNLGTLYRIKSSLLLPALFFGVQGAIWLAGRLARRTAP
jgi:hypothetical protein